MHYRACLLTTFLLEVNKKTNTIITKPARELATKSKDNRILQETKTETSKPGTQVTEITVCQGRVKTARTRLNGWQLAKKKKSIPDMSLP